MISSGEHAFEQGPRFFAPAGGGQRFDVPEGAHGEGVLRQPEIVRRRVAEEMIAPAQNPGYRLERADKARIGCANQTQFLQQQQARIDIFAAQHADEGAEFGVPGLFQQAMADGFGLFMPVA